MSHNLQPKQEQVLTPARISLGLTGAAIPTREQLRFQLDHALARDAVHTELDVSLLLRGLAERNLPAITLRSAAPDRKAYLRRPDLGRRLSKASREQLQEAPSSEIVFLLADGLSALAVERHALPLLDATLPLLGSDRATILIATQARVALGDEIGERLGAKLTVMFIGERPGLSSPDSLGVYITWMPQTGRTDAERNCISNIRTEGLSYADAAHRIAFYLREAKRVEATGIALKDPELPPRSHISPPNFATDAQ